MNTVFLISSLIIGAILPFAFAPFHLWPLGLIAPALFLIILQKSSAKEAFFNGLAFGLGMFGVGVSWVFVSVHHFGNTDIPLAVLLTGLFVLILALFIAIQSAVLKRYFLGSTLSFALLGFPASWVLFEWIRSWIFTGFPWLFLGDSQIDSPLGGFAPIGSVYLVSFLTAFLSGLLFLIFKDFKKYKIFSIFFFVSIFLSGALLNGIEWTTPIGSQKSVSLVQGNVDPLHKFGQKDALTEIDKIYGGLTQELWGRDLILWPESAIPIPLPYSQYYIDALENLAKTKNTTLITGIQIINENKEYHNSLVALGKTPGVYHKYHLLPYGDYLPFEKWLRGLINFFDLPMSSFVAGPEDQALLKSAELLLCPVICYEIVFPELIRDSLKNANAIITLSEDGWFGDSFGPHQHLQIARMRAKETGRPVLRSTTSGISAIIDSKGKIVATSPQFEATVLNGEFQGVEGNTPWLIIGIWPFILLLLLAFFMPGRVFKNF